MQVEVIIETLQHDGELVSPGTILDLELDNARALLDAGAVQEVSEKGSTAAAPAKTKKAAAKPTSAKKATAKGAGTKKGNKPSKEADTP